MQVNYREKIAKESLNHQLYAIRRGEFDNDSIVPFRVSNHPFEVSLSQAEELFRIGKSISAFMDCIIDLYKTESDMQSILNTGKPSIYKQHQNPNYLFLRPDLIITNKGFSVCEIETSPFGLALSAVLNSAYSDNFDLIANSERFKEYIDTVLPPIGTIVYSEKIQSFEGQLAFLAYEVFSGNERKWDLHLCGDDRLITNENVYRAFYLDEIFENKAISNLIADNTKKFIPSSTPQFEEKAILSFLYDKRFTDKIRKQLGESTFKHLREIIPETWIVGQEQYFEPSLPDGIATTANLMSVSKKKRSFVLKQSGFKSGSSWAEGVTFLNQASNLTCIAKIQQAVQDKKSLYVVQRFTEGRKFAMEYVNENEETIPMQARIRLTPYYAFAGDIKGRLITAKATGCEHTHFIHAGTNSINVPLSVKREVVCL